MKSALAHLGMTIIFIVAVGVLIIYPIWYGVIERLTTTPSP